MKIWYNFFYINLWIPTAYDLCGYIITVLWARTGIYSLIDIEINFWYFIYNLKLTNFLGTPLRRQLHTKKNDKKGGGTHSAFTRLQEGKLWKKERENTKRERVLLQAYLSSWKWDASPYKFWSIYNTWK